MRTYTLVLLAASLGLALGCRSQEPSFGNTEQADRINLGRVEGESGGRPSMTPAVVSNTQMAPTKMAVTAMAPTPPPAEPAGPPPPAFEAVVNQEILTHPDQATETAPANYVAELDTTKGVIRIAVTRAWAPKGADRFYNLVKAGYYTDLAFFRVIRGFMAQVGLHGDPAITRAWQPATIQDDPVTQSNKRGYVSFATAGPNTRVQQFFVNFGDNSRLDGMGFAPFGQVQNMEVVDALFSGYGEGAPNGRGPSQGRIMREGNTYLRADFPNLDYIRAARIVAE